MSFHNGPNFKEQRGDLKYLRLLTPFRYRFSNGGNESDAATAEKNGKFHGSRATVPRFTVDRLQPVSGAVDVKRYKNQR